MKNEFNKSSNHGGARKGAGRKKIAAKSLSIRIPEDVVEILDKVEGSKTSYIIEAIRAYAYK